MLLVPAALELSDSIQTLGAYAGFASVVGLAVLSLLYFGQARELRRLREWAGRAPERAAELQDRVEAEATAAAAAGQKRVVAQPVRPAAGVQPSTAAGAAAVPGVPAPAVPAPAVPAVPAANPGAPGALTVPPAATPAAATAAGAAAVPGSPSAPGSPAVPGVPAAPGAGTEQPTALTPGVPPARPASAPPTGGGTSELTLPPVPPPVPAGGSTQDSGETAVPLRRVSAAAASPAGAPTPPGGGKDKKEPKTKGDPAARGGALAIAGGVVALLLVGVLVATQIGGGDDTPPQGNVIQPTGSAGVTDDDAQDVPRQQTNTSTTPEVSPGGITVAVLNGTLTTGLAKGAADKVAAAGYKIGTITNASDQSRTTTTVQFAEGSRRAAEDVADRIGVQASAVSAIDEGTRVVAGDDAAVVVTVGADQQP